MNNLKLLSLLTVLALIVYATILIIRSYNPAKDFQLAEQKEQAELAEIRSLLGEAYVQYQNNDLNSAEKRLHLLLRNAPNNIIALQLLGNVYFRQKKYVEAEKTFRTLVRIDPYRSINYNNLGLTLFKQNKYADAIAEYKHAIQLEPELAQPRLNLAEVYIKFNHKKGALNELKKAVELTKEKNSIQINLNAFRALKDEKEFQEILESVGGKGEEK